MYEMILDRLAAVNLMLAGIGREPIATLDDYDVDSEMASQILSGVSQDIQLNKGEGWWFNTEKWDLKTSAPDYEIQLPPNTMVASDIRSGYDNRPTSVYVLRGRKLYNRVAHSYNLGDAHVRFKTVSLLQYEELPATATSAIAWAARAQFVRDLVGDEKKDGYNDARASAAMQAMFSEHVSAIRLNAFESPAMQEFGQAQRGWGSGR